MMYPKPPSLLPGTPPASLEERAKAFAKFAKFRKDETYNAELVIEGYVDTYEAKIESLADECMRQMYLMVGIGYDAGAGA